MARERKFSKNDLYLVTKDLLLVYGYEGFTFSLLAAKLDVSRGTLYKYYENKEELITDYMVDELNKTLENLQEINEYQGFEAQFHFLLDFIFQQPEIPQLIKMAHQIPPNINTKVRENVQTLDTLHLDMYKYLGDFIQLGRNEQKIKPHIPDGLILGFIFQTIAIPNHFGVSHSEWVESIKEILIDGMFTAK